MTEASKKRAKELADQHVEQKECTCDEDNYSCAYRDAYHDFVRGYQAGIQDPDSVKNHPVVRELVEALIAVQKYDSAIFVRAENGDLELDPMGALAGGHDLDALYMDMKTKTDDALTKWREFVGASSGKWYGKFGYSAEGVIDYIESENKEVAEAYVTGINRAIEEVENSGDDNPLEDYWTSVDQIEMKEE